MQLSFRGSFRSLGLTASELQVPYWKGNLNYELIN